MWCRLFQDTPSRVGEIVDRDNNQRELTAAESAAYLGYTLRSFYKQVPKIPHRKRSGVLSFKIVDLDEFDASRTTVHTVGGAA